jgi:hypothetical protein
MLLSKIACALIRAEGKLALAERQLGRAERSEILSVRI